MPRVAASKMSGRPDQEEDDNDGENDERHPVRGGDDEDDDDDDNNNNEEEGGASSPSGPRRHGRRRYSDDDEKENASDLQDPPGGAFKVCQGLTDQERREIRRKQRLLHAEMEEKGDDLAIEEARGRNNAIFRRVRYTREAVLDGENMNLIATRAAHKVDQLIQVRAGVTVGIPARLLLLPTEKHRVQRRLLLC
jgi:hypothetical protein